MPSVVSAQVYGYAATVALHAPAQDADGDTSQTLAVVRAIADPDRTRAEFAILVRSDLKGKGLGAALLRKMIRYCREQGISEIMGDVLWSNHRMLSLARGLGFEVRPGIEPGFARVRLSLSADRPVREEAPAP